MSGLGHFYQTFRACMLDADTVDMTGITVVKI